MGHLEMIFRLIKQSSYSFHMHVHLEVFVFYIVQPKYPGETKRKLFYLCYMYLFTFIAILFIFPLMFKTDIFHIT